MPVSAAQLQIPEGKTNGATARRANRLFLCILALLTAPVSSTSHAQTQQASRPVGTDLKPEPAIPAILGAFDKYEVVAMPEDHGLKDLDDLIFAPDQQITWV